MTKKVRRMTVKEGKDVNISRFPNFHRSGSVAGMRRFYYGDDALLVQCGQYIYNVDQKTYDMAH